MKITKTKTGYTTTVYIGRDQNGKSHSRRFSGKTRDEVKRAVADYQSRNRIYHESHAFNDALRRYLDARDGLRSPSTLRGYKSIERTMKAQYAGFCALQTDRITDSDVQKVIDELQRTGHARKTIYNWVGLINSVLESDKAQPVKAILPEKQVVDRPIPTPGEIRMMLCLMHGHKMELPFRLALMGLRRGEICALRPEDMDRNGVLHIQRAVVALDDGGTEVKDTPKTEVSNRYVQLPPDMAAQIRSQGYVTKYTLHGLSKAFKRFLRKYGFPDYRLHDCRHFFASYAHSQGVPEADILAGGGWKTPNVMRSVYRHSMAQNKATACVTGLFSGVG